jgi:hypothetical protein
LRVVYLRPLDFGTGFARDPSFIKGLVLGLLGLTYGFVAGFAGLTGLHSAVVRVPYLGIDALPSAIGFLLPIPFLSFLSLFLLSYNCYNFSTRSPSDFFYSEISLFSRAFASATNFAHSSSS